MPQFDANHLETSPGGVGPFAPPARWRGTEQQYREKMLEAYDRNLGRKQQIHCLMYTKERGGRVRFTGPFAATAEEVFCELHRHHLQRVEAQRAQADQVRITG